MIFRPELDSNFENRGFSQFALHKLIIRSTIEDHKNDGLVNC